MSPPEGQPPSSARSDRELQEENRELENERWSLLREIEDWLELPLIVLSAVWLVLLLVELMWGLNRFLEGVGLVIWGIFVLDFAVRFVVAPTKGSFMRANWLTALSLLTPALRLLRVFRLAGALRMARVARGTRLMRLVGGANRALRTLRRVMGRRQLGFVLSLTGVVLVLGAAGMLAFEQGAVAGGLEDFGDALWFSAMILTTLGSEYWPETPEGRVLAFLLALYSFAIFGYLTASLASFFIGVDAENQEGEIAGSREIEALRLELEAVRRELSRLGSGALPGPAGSGTPAGLEPPMEPSPEG
jgi:voltage-gated potassium channel